MQPAYPYPPQPEPPRKPRKKKHRFRRFLQGYLMTVGALTTLYVLAQLAVRLLVEVGRWMPD